jgi:DNA-binding beta-propeller fold protein YncE
METSNTFAVLDNVLKKIFFVSPAGSLIEELDINIFGLSSYTPYHIALDTFSNQLIFSDITGFAVSFLEPMNPVKLKKQLSTSAAGCTNPVGIGYVPENQRLLITDMVKDEVFVIDQCGSLKARFDTAGVLYSNTPNGIAYDPNNQIFALVDTEDHRINLLKLPALTKGVNRCEGDFDQDGDVDGLDLSTFAANFGRTDCP